MSSPAGLLDLSVAVIARDAERTIEATLRSVRGLARRVVVVDSGSTDGTLDLCRAHGAVVIEHPWEGYVRQKQFALDQCDSTWVLSLDSDESLDAEAADAVRGAVAGDDPAVGGYQLNRRVRVGEIDLRHTWQPEWRTRLVRRAQARWAGHDPHDRLDVAGPLRRIPGTIIHDSYTDVGDLVRKSVSHGLTMASSLHELGRRTRPWWLLVSPPAATFKQLVLRSAWRDGWPGWVAACAAGLHAAVKHMRLLELQHRGPRRGRGA
jgi:glycosyltransferase involved in cell wall biosynthesis